MTVIEATRELGKAIQADERYAKLMAAKEANEDKMNEYDKEFREVYTEVMTNENMRNYEEARQEVDNMMNYVMQLLSMVVNGEDPETCDPAKIQGDCTGSCSTCGGCG